MFKYAIQCGSHKMYWKTHPENFIEDDFDFGIKFPADNDTDKFEEFNQNVSVSKVRSWWWEWANNCKQKILNKMLNAILMP